MTRSKTQIQHAQIQPLTEVARADCMVVTTMPNRTDRLTAWRSSEYTVQTFRVNGGIIRISVNRSQLTGDDRVFKDGIPWEHLMEIKRKVGYGDRQAVEIYPEDCHTVNKINIRHLWVLPEPLPFSWQKDGDLIINFLEEN
jgi:hypothetical protein